MTVSVASRTLAVQNISSHGDTDVFPYPLENHWFHDEPDKVVDLLGLIDDDFRGALARYPVDYDKSLTAVGYAGFRGATQVDPIWNAYLLSLVLEIAPDLERARVSISRRTVFSYRFNPSPATFTLFEPDLGWRSFQKEALERSDQFEMVVATDISDFYSRIYHHRLENSLLDATNRNDVVSRIMVLLRKLTPRGTSFGLPVGGNAARMLAELLLDRTDRLLLTAGVSFCRFVDDYLLFSNTRGQAHASLVHLSDVLLRNEGLNLSRHKTRFMSRAEFQRLSPVLDPDAAESKSEQEARRFLSLRLQYDPYSQTAAEDYNELSHEIERFDIVGMLGREIRKSRVDERLSRQLIKSLRFLRPRMRDDAVLSLINNFSVLYPLFPSIVFLLRAVLPEMAMKARSKVHEAFRQLIGEGSHVTLVPTNLSFAITVLAQDPDEDATRLLAGIYERPGVGPMIRRAVILAMTKRRATFWLSDLLGKYNGLSPWEKRALIPASYVLGDEGSTWRDRVKAQWSLVDRPFQLWVASKNNGRQWDVPL